MHYDPQRIFERIKASRSLVIGQLGQTLDGRVATESGESLYINGDDALKHLHRLRAAVDAVIVGVGTIVADNPRLTVRLVDGETPARVVLDPSGRMPPDSRCLHDDAGPVITIGSKVCCDRHIALKKDANGHLPWPGIVAALAERGLHRLLIEGGPRTLSLAIDADAVDLLHIMVAPKLLGSGRAGLDLAPVQRLADARSPACETHLFEDGDVLFACDLR